jgi:hypothetical protein
VRLLHGPTELLDVGQDANGIWDYDQWRGHAVHKRLIHFRGGSSNDKSNGGGYFYLIC